MSRKTGKNPGRPRHIRGIPAAGPLFVNGVETPKGNVVKQVSRIYESVDPTLVDHDGPRVEVDTTRNGKGELIWEILFGRELEERHRTCFWCEEPIHRGQKAVFHRRKKGTNRAHHWRCRPPACPL